MNNSADGYGLYTNEGVIRKDLKTGRYQDAIDFTQERFGMTYGLGGKKVNMTYDENLSYAYGDTNLSSGSIRIGSMGVTSSSTLKSTMVHEYGHSVYDRIPVLGMPNWLKKVNGGYVWADHIKLSPLFSNQTLINDGPTGYANEIFNSGRLHVSYRFLSLPQNGNMLWNSWQGAPKWFYSIPMRFNNTVRIRNY